MKTSKRRREGGKGIPQSHSSPAAHQGEVSGFPHPWAKLGTVGRPLIQPWGTEGSERPCLCCGDPPHKGMLHLWGQESQAGSSRSCAELEQRGSPRWRSLQLPLALHPPGTQQALPAQGSSPGSIGLSLLLEKSPYMARMGSVTELSPARLAQGEP